MFQDTFTIKELFSKDIERNINGVVQAGQIDSATKNDELSEYVMTQEIEDNMAYFYQNYIKSLDQPTTAVGVWISGFFGSGKSHFLKILSYLLDGQPVYGKKPVDYFHDKTENKHLLDQMKLVANQDTHAILFNIESKTSSTSTHNQRAGNEKEMIVEAFLKAFNEHLGYSSTLWIADIERQIANASDIEAFKQAFWEVDGTKWEESREKVKFKRKSFREALKRIGVEEETATDLLVSANRDFAISSEDFAKLVAAHCKAMGPAYRLTFLVDEIGQYIGDDRRLMLNLQTVVEDLGKTCQGRVWVIVTSQEQVDSVTKIAGYDDFSKIQGRFPTRINLTSSNTDEVIRRRLLEKTDPATDELYSRYGMEEQSLHNLLAFDRNRYHLSSFGYRSAEDFVNFYPFIPYQIELLQKVFEKVRTQGEAGKHLAHGERSLLNAIQEVALELKEEGTDRLARFSQFYETIRRFLDSSIVSTINRAGERDDIKAFDLEVLKVLYMIKGIKEVEATADNLATLLIDSVDAIKSDVVNHVRQSLRRLKDATLIQQHADHTFTFLSDDEQEIQREVARTSINEANIDARLGRQFFNNIYSDPRFLYQQTPFEFNKRFNGFVKGTTAHDLSLHVVTQDLSEEEARLKSNNGTVIMRIPDDQGETFMEPIRQVERIASYLRVNNSSGLPQEYRRIFDDLEKQRDEFETEGHEKLKSACQQGVFYIDGLDYTFKGTVEHQINEALKKLVENTFPNWRYMEEPVPQDDAQKTVTEWGHHGLPQSTSGLANQLAFDEIRFFLERQHTAKLKHLMDRFTHKPYGWTEADIAGLVAALDQAGKVELTYMGESLEVNQQDYATKLLSKRDREKVELKVKEGMSPRDRGELTELLQEVFNHYEPVETYQDGARLLQKLIGEQKQLADTMVGIYRQGDSSFPYPDGEEIQNLQQEFQTLLQIYDAKTMVKQTIDAFDDISEGVDLLDRCSSFYQGKGIQLFDQAVRLLQRRADDLIAFDQEEGVGQTKEKIKMILLNPKPYRDIPHLSGLCDRLKNRLQELVEQDAQKVLHQLTEVQAAVEQLESEYEEHRDAVTLIKEAQSRLQGFKEAVQEVESRSTLSTYQDKAVQDYHRLQEEVTRVINGDETVRVTLSDLIPPTGKQLQDETELESFLNELRSQLHASLKQGKVHITR